MDSNAMNAASPSVIKLGVYPLPEAARLAQLDRRTARRWAEGYPYVHAGERRVSRGVMPFTLGRMGKERDLTFAELLTLRLVRAFRNSGLGLPTIKRVALRAAEDYGFAMPFISRRFRTDGRKVFMELRGEEPGGEAPGIRRHEREMIEVLTGQRAFADVVEPSLFANVDWQDDLASRWWPMGKNGAVVLDPAVAFGAPRIARTGVPTAVLAEAVRAEGGGPEAVEAVAGWYGVPPGSVEDAVRFETDWLKAA